VKVEQLMVKLDKIGLTRLPDDILLNILERIDTLDALRTCILSKRMLKLRTMLSRFDITPQG
jgi:hypothetical protein